MKNFIITKNEETANKLITAGFKLIKNNNGIWTFINGTVTNFNFEDIDKKTYTYSNKLCL